MASLASAYTASAHGKYGNPQPQGNGLEKQRKRGPTTPAFRLPPPPCNALSPGCEARVPCILFHARGVRFASRSRGTFLPRQLPARQSRIRNPPAQTPARNLPASHPGNPFPQAQTPKKKGRKPIPKAYPGDSPARTSRIAFPGPGYPEHNFAWRRSRSRGIFLFQGSQPQYQGFRPLDLQGDFRACRRATCFPSMIKVKLAPNEFPPARQEGFPCRQANSRPSATRLFPRPFPCGQFHGQTANGFRVPTLRREFFQTGFSRT